MSQATDYVKAAKYIRNTWTPVSFANLRWRDQKCYSDVHNEDVNEV